jgi:hypothetical protein
VTAIVAFGLGAVVGGTRSDDVGSPPAIDLAREVGLALPLDQQPAFSDGEITRAEVERAMERLTACVEAGDVSGFRIELAEDGSFSSEWSSGDANTVEMCRLRHFEATYLVWQRQEWRLADAVRLGARPALDH